MILGDFNADGVYVTRKEMEAIRIRSDKNFHWLIGDDVDTTANTSNEHTYDRCVYIYKLHLIGEEMALLFNLEILWQEKTVYIVITFQLF